MFSMQSSNPVLKSDSFKTARSQDGNVMTVGGAVNKTGLLLLITTLSAVYAWQSLEYSRGIWIAALIGSLVLGFITYSKPSIAHITAPLYAALEGVFLGSLSAMAEGLYPGIVANAIVLTFGILTVMLSAYKSGYIRATPRLQRMIGFGLMAYFVLAMVHIVSGLFGGGFPSLFHYGPIAIGISVLVVGLASFSLVMDFDEIESGARNQLPKQHEWLAAFGLIVTLVWLYFEILRLLIILNSSRD
jgi:uncharacterized YccA/Bax inhibitor family protein